MKKTLLLSTLLIAGAASAQEQAAFVVGAGVAVGSRYSGSDENVVAPVIILDYQAANGLYASTVRGLGYETSAGPLIANIGLGYRGGRRNNGTNSLFSGNAFSTGSATLNAGLAARLTDVFSVGVRADIPISRRENGKQYTLGANAKLLDSPADKVTLGLALQFGERKYMQTYYGVPARTGNPGFSPDGGLFRTNLNVTWERNLNAHWMVSSSLGLQHLVGDAADSPIVIRKTAPTAAVYAAYRF